MGDPSNPIFEIRVRAFYTSHEADIAPSTTVLVQADSSGQQPDWDKLLRHQVKAVAEQIHEFPATNIRAMTLAEADNFRADEGEEEK